MEADVLDLGWRGMLLVLVVLADAVVFADLVRAELREIRGNSRVQRVRDFGKHPRLRLGWLRRRPGAAHSL
jgi:hypothetical protein